MEVNPQIFEILKEYRISKDAGLLALLGIYYGLDIEQVVPEGVVKAINLTKIVDKDYNTKTIVWNVPLFKGQETAFGWVAEWVEAFGNINPERRGSSINATSRMKDFFKKYPQYRKEDVFRARDLYFTTIKDSKFMVKSENFIFDGKGVMKKSLLLEYCEKVYSEGDNRYQKGQVIS